ncbi:MAG: glutamine--fructose-6-phosphate transaminase (isomerizing) [Oscillospiraceae bacterium]|nr:glutamine--fructose-6-phosphate transaminase (isomerizing) [Oscillospiraceae bacterium]
MCGIVGFTGRDNAAPILLDGLKKLEYRGYDSAGVAINGDGVITMVKVSGKINNLCEKTENGAAISGSAGIGHTRWATHGAPNDINAHPHMSMDGKFAIVHNGIIENYAELRLELQESGYEFLSETDTEVIVHLLDHYYDGDLKETIMKTVSRLEGSYALGVICADFPDAVFAARQNSPLILGVGVGENYFASDVTALVSRTKNVIYLDDGELAELSPSNISIFDCIGRPVQKQISRVAWDIEAAEKGGYEHFMLKEIMEQPRAVKAAIEPRVRSGKIAFDELDLTDEYLTNVDRIYITACGSAFHAGQVGKYALEALLGVPIEVDFASEFRYRDPIINERSLVIVISQSGETADTIAALNEAKRRGAKTIAIVNVVGSTIAKTADNVLYTWAGPEIAVATTKGYTTQVAVLYMLSVCLASRLRRISAETEARLTEEILMLPSQIQRAIDLNPHIPYLAKRYHENSSVFFIGRNMDYAACLEGSLKLKEISYIHSEAYAAGELKHGTIALIEPGRLVVCLACCERLFDKMMSNVKEVKARGAKVIGVTAEGRKRIFSEADDVIFVPTAEELFCAVSEIIPLQLFAYHVAKENGCDIDKPKNLAKSVTVE